MRVAAKVQVRSWILTVITDCARQRGDEELAWFRRARALTTAAFVPLNSTTSQHLTNPTHHEPSDFNCSELLRAAWIGLSLRCSLPKDSLACGPSKCAVT